MANSWLRLWHDMPNDPKFRVVAKLSCQPISLVISLYVTLLCDASNNSMSRGVTQCHDEELAVTLDCDIEQIVKIKDVMQGRLLEGNRLTGWEKRQPKREDLGNDENGAKSAAARKREQREREKQQEEKDDVTQCHEVSRNVTPDKDKDKDKELKPKYSSEFEMFWKAYPKKEAKDAAWNAWKKIKSPAHTVLEILKALEWQKVSEGWLAESGKYIKHPATYLNAACWLDEPQQIKSTTRRAVF